MIKGYIVHAEDELTKEAEKYDQLIIFTKIQAAKNCVKQHSSPQNYKITPINIEEIPLSKMEKLKLMMNTK